MNKIVINNLIFDNEGLGNGKILDGSFYVENSLAEDELSIDTLNFTVRYPLGDVVDTSLTKLTYGFPCLYYQDDALFGRFYLVKVERTARFEYKFNFQSAMGLLDDSTHYGGIYQGELASNIIKDIISDKIPFTYKPIFDKIKLYGWLPIGTRRENLKQVLFACGGTVKKNENGDVYIATLDTTTPIDIPDSRVMENGRVEYEALASKVELVEHGFIKSDTQEREKVFEGEISGQAFKTPKGFNVSNSALIQFDGPYHTLEIQGTQLVNDEVGPNYCIVKATPNATITGIPYLHTEAMIYKNKANYQGEEKVATVKDATLVSLANSGSTAERVLAYYGNSNTLSTSIILDGEKPTNTITLSDPFGDKVTGFIKNMDGDFGNHVSKADVDVILNYNPPVVVGSRTLTSIAVTKLPTQTSYATGDYFDTAGMEVTAYYDDGTTNILNNFTYSPTEQLKESDTKIVISYTELGVTCKTEQSISVVTLLRRIAITTPPDNTAYYEEDYFDTTGMVITAYYSDGSSKIVPDGEYTYYPNGELTKQDETITITYTDTGVTVQAYQDITVGDAPNLVSISITQQPDKTSYKLGQFFDTTGMVVTAYFDNGTSKPVNGYTYSPAGALGMGDTTITVTYIKNGIQATDSLTIEIVYLTSIAITTPPTYTEYYEGNNFNKYGMVVTAYYSNNTSAVLDENAYTVTPTSLVCADTQVTISYTEQGITKTAIQAITVTYYPYDYTNSMVISDSGTYHLSDLGATHRNIRVIAISGGNGGYGGMNGQSGGSSNSSSISTGRTGSDSSPAGNGGSGGVGGPEVEGGMFYALDIVLDNDQQDIVINVGQGGAGGSACSYNSSGNVNAGEAGGETTCQIGNATITSGSGSSNPNGYTDIFTENTYALKGEAGQDAGNGGSGGSYGNTGSSGGSYNGNSGGSTARGSTTSTPYTSVEQKGPTISQSWSSQTTEISGGPTTKSISGATSYTVNSSTGKITTSGYRTIGYIGPHPSISTWPNDNNKNMKQYNPGTVYTDVSNDSVPSSKPNGTYYSKVTEHVCTTSNQTLNLHIYQNATHSGTKKRTLTVSRVYVYKEHDVTVSTGYGGGGGGGASFANPGGSASSKSGGSGGGASTPSTPTSFGSSGNSGSGGGGGGGAGGTYASISGDNAYCKKSASMSGGSGGSGGSGSAGANGAKGCVIIYYS